MTKVPKASVPESLFHYTDADGLLGILEGKVLWATDVDFLNDAAEYRFAAGLLREELLYLSNNPRVAELDLAVEALISGEAPLPPEFNQFVVSFCDSGDLLSMWRGYGRSGGFAIEFDSARLVESMDSTQSNALNPSLIGDIIPVRYGDQAQHIIKSIVEGFLDSEQNPSVEIFAWNLMSRLVQIKDPTFAEEREVRLVARAPACWGPAPKIRTTSKHLVSYQEIQFPEDAILSIRVGPGPYQARNIKVLERYGLPSPRGERMPTLNTSLIPLV